MERLLRELHHLVAFSPGIQAAVHDGRGDDIGPMCQGCAEIVDTAITVDGAHALTHQLLLRVGGAEVVKLLAPQIDLITEIHLDRAHSLTTQTECAGTYVARVLLGVAKHTEVYADGARDKVAVGIAA